MRSNIIYKCLNYLAQAVTGDDLINLAYEDLGSIFIPERDPAILVEPQLRDEGSL